MPFGILKDKHIELVPGSGKSIPQVSVNLFSTAIVGNFGPTRSLVFVQFSAEFGISVNTLSQSTAWLILTISLCLFIVNPVAKMYGKRPAYISAILFILTGSVWGAYAKKYASFLESRVFLACVWPHTRL